jgi:hypothetical protein
VSYSRTFSGYAPPARGEDDEPFITARIREALALDGPFTTIEEIELDPVDTDPSNPAARTLSTDKAELDPAYYSIVWVDGDDVEAEGPVIYASGSSLSWAPAVQDIADLLWARTKDTGGNEGEFNENTRPTATQVQRLIGRAVRRVASAIGIDPCTGDLREDARAAAALYAAMLVEQSYFPEQTRNEGSSFASLNSLWKDAIRTLTEAVGERCGGGDGSAVGGTGQMPSSNFDDRTILGPAGPAW